MTPVTPPDSSALSPDDAACLAKLIADILAHEAPALALAEAVRPLEPTKKPAVTAALYEALCYRVDTRHHGLHDLMWQVYRALGPAREDAAFLHAATALRMQPDRAGSGLAARHMFKILCRRGREPDALALFRHTLCVLPAEPVAEPDEIFAILRRLEPAAPEIAAASAASRPGALRLHPLVEAQVHPPWNCPVFGGAMPYSLVPQTYGLTRDAITVAEFTDAEVLILRDQTVVLDRFGDPHHASSVAPFPAAIRGWFDRQEAAGQWFPVHEAEEAVVISDRWALPNVCHTLLDHATRLALYQRLGVDSGRALVIGPEPTLPAQREILRRAGVHAYLGTAGVARVRARRLWVSSNCRSLCHAAHYGADWAVAFARETLGGPGQKGWRRLYLSRADVPSRQVSNEAEVIALLELHGFEAIVPGRMAYDAQLAAFRQASHVIAPHGAALAHLILCPPGARVLEIFHPLYGSASYALQATAAGLEYAAMVARDFQSDAPEWNDPTLVDLAGSPFLARHMRVDLDVLSSYLATVV